MGNILGDIENVQKSPGGKTHIPLAQKGKADQAFPCRSDISIGEGYIQTIVKAEERDFEYRRCDK